MTNSGKTSFIKLAINNKICINLNICYNNKTAVKVQATKFLCIQNHNNSNCKTRTARILQYSSPHFTMMADTSSTMKGASTLCQFILIHFIRIYYNYSNFIDLVNASAVCKEIRSKARKHKWI